MAAISQRHGFPENRVADQGLNERRITTCTRRPRSCFQVGDEASRKPGRCLARHVDEEIDIAVERVIPASHGAEKPDIARAVAGSHPQDLVAAFF